MNVERMNALADLLETVPEKKFDMGAWVGQWGDGKLLDTNDQTLVGSCGTTACVAGWATVLLYPTKPERDKAINKSQGISQLAMQGLELTDNEAEWLFMGRWGRLFMTGSGIGRGTNKEAAQAVRAMAQANGVPDFKLT